MGSSLKPWGAIPAPQQHPPNTHLNPRAPPRTASGGSSAPCCHPAGTKRDESGSPPGPDTQHSPPPCPSQQGSESESSTAAFSRTRFLRNSSRQQGRAAGSLHPPGPSPAQQHQGRSSSAPILEETPPLAQHHTTATPSTPAPHPLRPFPQNEPSSSPAAGTSGFNLCRFWRQTGSKTREVFLIGDKEQNLIIKKELETHHWPSVRARRLWREGGVSAEGSSAARAARCRPIRALVTRICHETRVVQLSVSSLRTGTSQARAQQGRHTLTWAGASPLPRAQPAGRKAAVRQPAGGMLPPLELEFH